MDLMTLFLMMSVIMVLILISVRVNDGDMPSMMTMMTQSWLSLLCCVIIGIVGVISFRLSMFAFIVGGLMMSMLTVGMAKPDIIFYSKTS
jgi:hypothetical protein